jgi:NAD(P)H dehydrogenase (quinone)
LEQSVPGATVNLVPVADAEARAAELDGADAIIFGSPTYMGGVSAEFAKFKDWTAKRWMEGTWRTRQARRRSGRALAGRAAR